MDYETLVETDIEKGQRVIDALHDGEIDVDVAFWAKLSIYDSWRLLSPLNLWTVSRFWKLEPKRPAPLTKSSPSLNLQSSSFALPIRWLLPCGKRLQSGRVQVRFGF